MTYHSSQLEELMFGEKNYLQKNCKIEYRKDVNMHRDDSAIRYYFYIGVTLLILLHPWFLWLVKG
jgi:hypothetical protein